MYRLAESGVIYAQLIAQRARLNSTTPSAAELGESGEPPKASAEATRFLKVLTSTANSLDAAAHKLALLNGQDRAYVLDELLRAAIESSHAATVISQIVESPTFPRDHGILLVEQMVRGLTLYGDIAAKSEFLRAISSKTLSSIYEGLRLAFFEDLIGIVNRDQFDEVNKIVLPMTEHVSAIPPELYKDYVFALLHQARSSSWHGAPAARRALLALPEAATKAAMESMDTEFLFWNSQHEPVREFAARYKHLVEGSRREVFEDLANMSNRAFVEKHIPYDGV